MNLKTMAFVELKYSLIPYFLKSLINDTICLDFLIFLFISYNINIRQAISDKKQSLGTPQILI